MSSENCILAGKWHRLPASGPHLSPEHASFSGRATTVIIRRGFALLQLNAKGFSKAMTQVVQYLAAKSIGNSNRTTRDRRHESRRAEHIPGYNLAAYTSSIVHGEAIFMQWRDIASSTPAEEVEWTGRSQNYKCVQTAWDVHAYRWIP